MSIPNDFFDHKGNFTPMKLVKFITGDELDNRLVTPITIGGGDVMWHYKHEIGIYRPNGIAYVKEEAKRALGKRCKTSHVNEVVFLSLIDTYIQPDEFIEDPNLLVVKNGVLHLDTREFTKHNHMDYAKAALPVVYNPEAECPLILKFLEKVAPEYITFLQEWTGYHFLKDYRYQRAVVLVGDGDNGKSTYLSLLKALLGSENVSGQTMYRLTVNRFAPAELYGKLANIAADIGHDELRRTGILKMLTGGDIIAAERKGRDPFNYINHAKLNFSCNRVPRTPDESLAFHKRFIVLPWEVIIPKEEQDPVLIKKLTTPEELSGLLNWALAGLTRLMENQGFTEPSTIEERRELYKRMSDPITGFINDCIIEDPQAREDKQNVLRAFNQYCKDNGFVPPSDMKFIKEFRNQVYYRETQKTVKKQRIRFMLGIKLIGSAQGTQPAQGTIPPFVGTLQPTVVKPVQVVQVVQASQIPEPSEGLLLKDAIDIINDHGGHMQQQWLFQALLKLGYHSSQANQALRGDPRFVFMGMEIGLASA